jgi:hypothetical protein
MKALHLVIATTAVAIVAGITYWYNYEKWIELPAARRLMAAQLRDPDGTQFRNDRFTRSGWLCGELNAKNGAGGYVGFRRFISGGRDGDYYVEGEGEVGKLTFRESTDRVLAVLEHQIRLTKEAIAMRAQQPDMKAPTERELAERAEAAYITSRFENKWREVCEP